MKPVLMMVQMVVLMMVLMMVPMVGSLSHPTLHLQQLNVQQLH
jgi:hypothetical protein